MNTCERCNACAFGFTNWRSFTEAANEGKHGFDDVPNEGGVYCLRVMDVGEINIKKIISDFLRPQLREAFRKMSEASRKLSEASKEMSKASEEMFKSCGLPDWALNSVGCEDWEKAFDGDLSRLRNLSINPDDKLDCPILYIGRSDHLVRRMWDLMAWKHPFSVILWALLGYGWTIELAWLRASDNRTEEKRVGRNRSSAYRQSVERHVVASMAG